MTASPPKLLTQSGGGAPKFVFGTNFQVMQGPLFANHCPGSFPESPASKGTFTHGRWMLGAEQPRQPTDFSTQTLEIIEMIVITAAVHSDTHHKPGPCARCLQSTFLIILWGLQIQKSRMDEIE